MKTAFSNLAICILGGAFLISPINQMEAEASQLIVESSTQQMNEILNRYRVGQQQPQQELQNPILVSQNFIEAQNRIVEQFNRQSNQIVNQYNANQRRIRQPSYQRQPSYIRTNQSIVEQFNRQTDQIVNQYNANQRRIRQRSYQRQPSYIRTNQSYADILNQQSNQISNQYRQNSTNRVSNSSPNIDLSTFRLYQQLPHVINRNWVRSY